MDVANNADSTNSPQLGGITGKGFMPGQSGNPSGRPKKKPITELYERMLQNPEILASVEAAITKLVSQGDSATVTQLKEIADRLEGKAIQAVEHSGPEGGPIRAEVKVEFVRPNNGTDHS